ncbi:MAG: acyl-[acyl-carrier-protein]--UDP-N-acetylglucosamine O-acyltransferase, partial [Opitutales bacterium]
ATVHLATADGNFTRLGNDCHVLAYSHIAHDCQVGDHLVMSSHSALGGHVAAGDHVTIGWGVGIHQFVRLGSHAMVGACSKAVQDVPPFCLAEGNPAEVRYINKVGLERRGFAPDTIAAIRKAYKVLYREGLSRGEALAKIEAMPEATSVELSAFISFVRASERGLA